MKLKEIYQFFVREGIKSELRRPEQVKKCLSDKKKEFKKLSASKGKFFDKDRLWNPYADTRVLYGDPQAEIKTILVGIDMEVGELLLADRLSQGGKKIDLVLAHHPEGTALAALDDVMHLQTDLLNNVGIDADVAQKLIQKRKEEIARRLHSGNHSRNVDVARLLKIPFMCCHTPADNHVALYLQKLVDRTKPKTLKDVLNLLLKEKEYQQSSYVQSGPEILIGSEKDKAGKIFVDMTGGTEGSAEVFGRLSQAGIKTLLGMHYSDNHYKRLKAEFVHVVNAGHIASDNLGMNLLLDKLCKKDNIEILDCSGFKRVRR